ncbi:hypothetical protein ACFV1U_38620 [Streptomyces microflavus]|uniref:hypothetical protein n=1 Tax=Streptomyces microflavus TaxID=1919 RepID=UPI003699BF6E
MTTPRPRPTTPTTAPTAVPAMPGVAASDRFFAPDARYYDGDPYKAPEQTHTFDCKHVATHPRPGAGLRAFGFMRNNAPNSKWESVALTETDFGRWTRIPDSPAQESDDRSAEGLADTALTHDVKAVATAHGQPRPAAGQTTVAIAAEDWQMYGAEGGSNSE